MKPSTTPFSPQPPKIFSCTHQGARNYQEDRHGHWTGNPGPDSEHFIVVIDGAGGHGGGAEAAEAAIKAAAQAWNRNEHPDPADFLKSWMETAHDAVNQAGKAIQRSARAVVVACLTDGKRAHWIHAGDSRLFHFRQGAVLSRTRDDSVVQVLFEQGEIREEEMGTHPDQGRLLQSLGGEDPPNPRLGGGQLEPGDALLLCTDGFWEHLSRGELEALVQTPPRRMQEALDAAVEAAVTRAGPKADNTTATLVIFGGHKPASVVPSWILLAGAALLGIGVVLALYFYQNRQGGGQETSGIEIPPSYPAEVLEPPEPPVSTPDTDPSPDKSSAASSETENSEPTATPEP